NLIPAPAVTNDRAESGGGKRRNSVPLPVAQAIIEPSPSSVPRGKAVAPAIRSGKALPSVASESKIKVSASESGTSLLHGRKKSMRRNNAKPALASVKQFRAISKLNNIKLATTHVAITGLWLSTSEQGETYRTPADGAADKSANYLVIKLQIDNTPDAAPLDY